MADPIGDTLTAYQPAIATLYDNLKKAYTDQAATGLDFSKQMSAHLNDAINTNQALYNTQFDKDEQSVADIAQRMNAPDVNMAAQSLKATRDRLAALHGLAQSAATDRMNYLGNIQDQYMNRLGDSAQATGAMKQAELISNIAKIKAAAAAQAAAARATASRSRSGGGGGGGGGSTNNADTITGKSDVTSMQTLAGLSQSARDYINQAQNQYGSDWIPKTYDAYNMANVLLNGGSTMVNGQPFTSTYANSDVWLTNPAHPGKGPADYEAAKGVQSIWPDLNTYFTATNPNFNTQVSRTSTAKSSSSAKYR